VDEALSDSQLSLDLTAPPTGAQVAQEPVLVADNGRLIDDETIRQAVQLAEKRLAEQSRRQARRLAQVSLWRSGR
jgi:hypothetical protein